MSKGDALVQYAIRKLSNKRKMVFLHGSSFEKDEES